jgi:dephospho-CoA kinase
MNKIYFVIGASGSGKTTILKDLENENNENYLYCYFDSVGVPSNEEMIHKFGSGENWQKEITKYWVKKIKKEYLNTKSVILDGQIRPSFIEEACSENNINNYEVILFDCSDEIRKKRLIERGHSELVTEQMMNWAKYLREESISKEYKIINNSNMTKESTKVKFTNLLEL